MDFNIFFQNEATILYYPNMKKWACFDLEISMLEKKCNQGGHKSEGENCLQTHVGSWVDLQSTTEYEHNHSQAREHYESHSVRKV